MKKLLNMALTASMLFGLAACGGSSVKAGPGLDECMTSKEHPWVMQGAGAFSGEKKVFYGVGIHKGTENPALARTTVDAAARASVGAIFDQYTAQLTKRYMASTTAGDFSATSEEQHVEDALKSFTQTKISGIQISDYCYAPSTNTWYGLARYDLDLWMNEITASDHKELNAKIRDMVKQHAAIAFDELEKEEAKHAN